VLRIAGDYIVERRAVFRTEHLCYSAQPTFTFRMIRELSGNEMRQPCKGRGG
jgi:hypothetical protein